MVLETESRATVVPREEQVGQLRHPNWLRSESAVRQKWITAKRSLGQQGFEGEKTSQKKTEPLEP